MKSFSSLKDSALKTLENKWGQFVAITLVAYVIGSGVGFVPYVGTLLTLAVIPLGYGYSIAILKNYRGGEIQLVDIFDAYKNTEVLGRVLLTLLLRGVYTFLWFLLSILTLGIGFLWFTPYYMSAKSAYYHGLLEDEANKEPYGPDDYVKVLPTE